MCQRRLVLVGDLKTRFWFYWSGNEWRKVLRTPKDQYKVEIRKLIQKAAFKYFTEIQVTHQKIKYSHYEALRIQTYLVDNSLSVEEIELLYILRFHCHKSKLNFKKLHKNALVNVVAWKSKIKSIHLQNVYILILWKEIFEMCHTVTFTGTPQNRNK